MPRKSAERATPDLRTVLQSKGKEAVAFLVDLMNDPEAKPELRFKAAESILDRVLDTKSETATWPDGIRFEGVLDDWSR